MQQENQAIKKLIKEKVDIKNMAVRITEFKNRSNRIIILDCESAEDLKTTQNYSTNH